MDEYPDLAEQAKIVLEMNDKGSYTGPAEGPYPHQWLWDSCFIAIGQRHYDVDRAQLEILHLLTGQWHNGMLPNIVMAPGYRIDHNIWRSWLNPNAPDNVDTTGITQPPMLAEAIHRIGQKLSLPERRTWYKMTFPALLAYHQWIHNDRDPHQEGLALLIHPWESGLDNTPPWMQELRDHRLPVWIALVEKLHLDMLVNVFRRDTHFIPAAQRMSTVDALLLFNAQRRLRRKAYDTNRILDHSLFAIEDLNFNCILIRADQLLVSIAKTIHYEVPDELIAQMKKTEAALEQLWDPYSNQYYSRNFSTHKLIKQSSIATLLPLYTGCITKERAALLVKHLENQHMFGTAYPVPTVPITSSWFNEHSYWQGPAWINTNWLIIDGLTRNGYKDHARALTESTLEMISKGGFREYFSPIDGSPAGATNFSWTAALTIDLLKTF